MIVLAALLRLQRLPPQILRRFAKPRLRFAGRVQTVAVLPFRDLSGGSKDEDWGIGMTDAIITRLASLQNLAVRPTSAVIKYAQDSADPIKAAQELGVDSVLDGTYQRLGDVMRVSVQLIDRQNQSARWAQRYDLQASDMLKFQDDIAQKVVEGLRVQMSGEEQNGWPRFPRFSRSLQPVSSGTILPATSTLWLRHLKISARAKSRLRQAIAKDPPSPKPVPCSAISTSWRRRTSTSNSAEILVAGGKAQLATLLELNPSLPKH